MLPRLAAELVRPKPIRYVHKHLWARENVRRVPYPNIESLFSLEGIGEHSGAGRPHIHEAHHLPLHCLEAHSRVGSNGARAKCIDQHRYEPVLIAVDVMAFEVEVRLNPKDISVVCNTNRQRSATCIHEGSHCLDDPLVDDLLRNVRVHRYTSRPFELDMLGLHLSKQRGNAWRPTGRLRVTWTVRQPLESQLHYLRDAVSTLRKEVEVGHLLPTVW